MVDTLSLRRSIHKLGPVFDNPAVVKVHSKYIRTYAYINIFIYFVIGKHSQLQKCMYTYTHTYIHIDVGLGLPWMRKRYSVAATRLRFVRGQLLRYVLRSEGLAVPCPVVSSPGSNALQRGLE